MTAARTYGDACGIARALDVVGERWALLIARELVLGPKRFTDLRTGLPRLSPNILSQRLDELESAGVVARRTLPPPAGSRVYELTPRGHELQSVLVALGRWGSQVPLPAGGAPLGVDAAMVALPTLFDAGRAADLRARIELRLDGERFQAVVHDGRLELARAAAEPPDAVVETDPGTLAQVLWHGRRVPEAVEAGAMRTAGSRRLIGRFLKLFPLPAP